MDPVAELCAMLTEIGARVTLDYERSNAKPCLGCGTTSVPRELVTVGSYLEDGPGNLRRGDPMVRPMCATCK